MRLINWRKFLLRRALFVLTLQRKSLPAFVQSEIFEVYLFVSRRGHSSKNCAFLNNISPLGCCFFLQFQITAFSQKVLLLSLLQRAISTFICRAIQQASCIRNWCETGIGLSKSIKSQIYKFWTGHSSASRLPHRSFPLHHPMLRLITRNFCFKHAISLPVLL